MATPPTFFATGDDITVKIYEAELGREIRDRTPMLNPKNGFVGKERTRLIRVKDQLTKGPGDSMKSNYRYQPTGRGRTGREYAEGFEEGLKYATDDLAINILRHGIGVEGEMSNQRVAWEVMDEAADAIADWASKRLEFAAAGVHLPRNTLVTDEAYRLFNTVRAPNTSYLLRPNGVATANALTASDVMSVAFLRNLELQLRLLRPRIQPARIDGIGNRFVVSLSPEMHRDLMLEGSDYYNLMVSGIQGGKFDNNPLIGNVIGDKPPFTFVETDHLPPALGTTANTYVDKTRRGWVAGAGGLFIGFGRGNKPGGYGLNRWQFDHIERDVGQEMYVHIRTIIGMQSPEYTDPDEATARPHGVLVFETAADYSTAGSGLTAAQVYEDHLAAAPGSSVVTGAI